MNKVQDIQNPTVKMRQFPKSIIYFFLLSHMVYGFDFGFSMLFKNAFGKFLQFLSHIISLAFVLILLSPLILTTKMNNDVTCWCSFCAYLGYVIVVKRSTYKIFNLITDVNEIFVMFSFEKRVISVFAIIYTSIIIATKFSFQIVQCIAENDNETYCSEFNTEYYIIYYFPYSSFDVITTTEIIIYYYIYCCIKKLKESLSHPGKDMKLALMKYAAIADCCDKIKPLYDDLVTLQVFTGVPAFMYSLITSLLYLSGGDHWSTYSNRIVYSVVVFLEISVPPLVTEMVNSQVDAIKMLLNNQLMAKLDEKRAEEMEDLIDYIDARPLHSLVWRFIPVDLRLILNVFNICTTYLIVIVQFLHVYD